MVNNGMEYGCIDVEMRLSYHLRHYVGVEFRWPSAGAAFLKVSEVREASEAFLDVNHVEVQQKWYKLMTWSNDTWTKKNLSDSFDHLDHLGLIVSVLIQFRESLFCEKSQF